MINFPFKEKDYATYEDFNEIEAKILIIRDRIYNLGYTDIPSWTGNYWQWTDYLFYNKLNIIEEGIKNIGKYYFRPKGWKKGKQWKPNMSFSYKDINRWVENLNLVEERLDNESSQLFPRDDLYPSETLLPH